MSELLSADWRPSEGQAAKATSEPEPMNGSLRNILPAPSDRRRFFWPLLLAGLTLATLLPIGIHTVMLDGLGVPYPSAFPHSGWATVPDLALLVFGVLCLNTILDRHHPFSALGRLIFTFLTLAAINEALFRLPIMLNVVSTKWTIYPFIDNLPAVLKFAVIASLVLFAAPFCRSVATKIPAAILIAAFVSFLVAPLLHRVFAGVVAADAKREGDQLYTEPYDWHVDLPSYLTYIEPAFAALIVALTLRRCGASAAVTITIIFAMLGGPLFRLVLNIFYVPRHPIMAVLSESQFSLEAIALAILVAGISFVAVPIPADRGAGTLISRG